MSKMKEIEQVAEFMATTAQETLMQNAEWAIDGTSIDKLSGVRRVRTACNSCGRSSVHLLANERDRVAHQPARENQGET